MHFQQFFKFNNYFLSHYDDYVLIDNLDELQQEFMKKELEG